MLRKASDFPRLRPEQPRHADTRQRRPVDAYRYRPRPRPYWVPASHTRYLPFATSVA